MITHTAQTMKKRPQIEACCELLFDGFKALTDEIERQGYDRETAGHYAALIGDTPVLDEQGNVLVMEGGKIIATLKPLDFFGDIKPLKRKRPGR